jgi:hypothetical protein
MGDVYIEGTDEYSEILRNPFYVLPRVLVIG